jgi:hypothetical protein
MSERDILLILSLGVFPLLYLALCLWMRRAVSNPPWLAFFFIFGSIAGYLLLCAYLMPSPVGLFVVLPYMLVAYLVLIGVLIATLRTRPRSRFHVAAAVSSGLLVVAPLVLIVLASVFRVFL